MIKLSLSIALSCIAWSLMAQFSPQAPLPGHEGIPADDPRIRSWAGNCTFDRGWKNSMDTSLGTTTSGSSASLSGAPDANVLSLGDKGSAIVSFPAPLRNGPGPDFAVFENGFGNPQDPAWAYLEFAFVEVSSDGLNYFRFPAVSNTQDTQQIDNFTYMDASLIHNLAGKYINGYGTPFDLEELKDEPGLDVNNVRFVRIIDVVGSIDSTYAAFDKNGRIINDPFPSPYPTGGFDLNAIAVLNEQVTTIAEVKAEQEIFVYPNPARDFICISSSFRGARYAIMDPGGRMVQQGFVGEELRIPLQVIHPGMYFLRCTIGKTVQMIPVSIR